MMSIHSTTASGDRRLREQGDTNEPVYFPIENYSVSEDFCSISTDAEFVCNVAAAQLEKFANDGEARLNDISTFLTDDLDQDNLTTDFVELREDWLDEHPETADSMLAVRNGYVSLADTVASKKAKLNSECMGRYDFTVNMIDVYSSDLHTKLTELDPDEIVMELGDAVAETRMYQHTYEALAQAKNNAEGQLSRFSAVASDYKTRAQEAYNNTRSVILSKRSLTEKVKSITDLVCGKLQFSETAVDHGTWVPANNEYISATGVGIAGLLTFNWTWYNPFPAIWTGIKAVGLGLAYLGKTFWGWYAAKSIKMGIDIINPYDIQVVDSDAEPTVGSNYCPMLSYSDPDGPWIPITSTGVTSAQLEYLQSNWRGHSAYVNLPFANLVVSFLDFKIEADTLYTRSTTNIRLKPTDPSLFFATPLYLYTSDGAGKIVKPVLDTSFTTSQPRIAYAFARAYTGAYVISQADFTDYIQRLTDVGAFGFYQAPQYTETFAGSNPVTYANEASMYNAFAISHLLLQLYMALSGPATYVDPTIGAITPSYVVGENEYTWTYGWDPESPTEDYPTNADWARLLYGFEPSLVGGSFSSTFARYACLDLISDDSGQYPIKSSDNHIARRLARAFLELSVSGRNTYWTPYLKDYPWPDSGYELLDDSSGIKLALKEAAQVLAVPLALVGVAIAIKFRRLKRNKFWKRTEFVGRCDNAMWNGQSLTPRDRRKYLRYTKKLSNAAAAASITDTAYNQISAHLPQQSNDDVISQAVLQAVVGTPIDNR